MRSSVLVAASLLHLLVLAAADKCSWQNCPAYTQNEDVLNVHLICHTHDDLGWIKTVDQYYWGSKRELVAVGVQYIYNTVIDELEKDPSRRFSLAETGFLWRWMLTHDERQHERLKKLIQNGQIEMIGGGWVQNDEAASHYIEIIDQMSWGLQYLNRTFGECGRPKVGWQIDPFGHSKEYANLCSKFGFNALFFARMHYLEKAKRIQERNLEFVWDSSDDLKTTILTGAFFQDNYGPPPGFCFDRFCGDDPIMDNEELEGYNVDQKVQMFVEHIKKQRSAQRHNHIMLLMGSDFQYSNANTWYTNLDKLIKYVNEKANGTVKVFYSTPSCYVDALTGSGVHVEKKSDDLFPYASSNHSYWTGYFTSRPTFKRFIRESNAFMQLLKKLDALAFVNGGATKWFSKLDRATALTQHHDAVTGTAKQNVTNDYSLQLYKGWQQGTECLKDIIEKLTKNGSSTTSSLAAQRFCLLNETNCDISQKSPNFTVTVCNSYTQAVVRIVRVPLHFQAAKVFDPKGAEIQSEVVKSFLTSQLPSEGRAPFELQFSVTVPPLGFVTYFVVGQQSGVEDAQRLEKLRRQKNATTRWRRNLKTNETTVSNGAVELTFDANGLLKAFTDLASKTTKPLRQEFLFYKGMGNDHIQPTGAYIFRPNGSESFPVAPSASLKIVKTNLLVEVRQVFSPWVSQVIRLVANKKVVEFQWTVGPIPKEKVNPVAKEVISRFTTDIASDGYFYTDSNGRQMMERRRNSAPAYTYENTEPVAANYFPITSTVYIKDAQSQLTVCTDRSQGGSSLQDGQIELMVHRRAFHDDHWGVEEPLDEPGRTGKGLVATGSHFLMLEAAGDAKLKQRVLAQEVFHEPFLTFAELRTPVEDYLKQRKTEFSGLLTPLPPQLNVLTLELVKKGVLILRLEHILQNTDDKVLSAPFNIDLKGMFAGFEIVNVEELTLGANERIKASAFQTRNPIRVSRSSSKDGTDVMIAPMDIKTFRLEVRAR
ncbi:hypothetical protein QR680_016716 [Steinernema hermaphroditum]|uniref:Alpha-mannosidase n=1 Tax=Steinernema hermaphroditum TaxID=289476 RepID=A0AA39HC43_9BILA|nr:hypothetical protein QR680_016716 [Steinernema hermaphroditum]